jgi:DNA-binding MarR family transcriptional regulator
MLDTKTLPDISSTSISTNAREELGASIATICLTYASILGIFTSMKQKAGSELVAQWWDELERLARILGQIGPDEVCCDGLSQRQTAILRVLVASEGARLMDLAAMSGITPSAMTRVLEKLESRGLVERVRGAHPDGRAAMVRITAAGRRTRKQLDELMRDRTHTIIEAIPPKQRAEVLSALELLNNAIESAGCCALNAPVATLTQIKEQK